MNKPAASSFLALIAMLATAGISPAAGRETDQGVLQAERTLRAAEARNFDETAMRFYERAVEESRAALERNPRSAGANFVYFAAKGRILLAEGLTTNLLELRALDREYLDRAIELNPNYANALAAKGGVLLGLPSMLGGDPEEALRLLRRANRINPGGTGTRVSLAKALARNGHLDEAEEQVRLAAHYACVQGRRKALDDAVALSRELGVALARADLR